ncbi:unnamed protein product [Ophioblennius macclurei]
MPGIKGKWSRAVIRRVVPLFLLTNIIMLLYCLTSPSHVKHRNLQVDACPATMTKESKTCLEITTRSLENQSDQCSPKVDIMFMKTHKTASSTILNILFRFGQKHQLTFALPDGRNDFYYPSPFRVSQVKGYTAGKCFNVVCNHMRFDRQEVAKLLPPDAAFVTILRDPVDLFESSFNYYRWAIPLTWWIRGKDKLSEFLKNPRAFYSPEAYNSFYLKNLLFFDFGFDNNLEADDPRVMTDIHSLSKDFHLVLIAEHFDESLILLKDLLCWTTEDILYFKLNVRASSSVSRLDPEMRAKALQWNGADWKLYRHFNATFWAKVEAYGAERMKREVTELRRKNAEMQTICIEGEGAVEATKIRDTHFLPWQPVGQSSIMGYNLKKDIDPKFRTLCEKMLTPELQYLSDLGVNLWVTKLFGWLKNNLPFSSSS